MQIQVHQFFEFFAIRAAELVDLAQIDRGIGSRVAFDGKRFGGCGGRFQPAQHGQFTAPFLHDAAKILEADWLGEIIVHARGETLLAITLHGAGCHGYDDYRRAKMRVLGRFLFALPDDPGGFQPAHPRHHEIHENQIEPGLFKATKGLFAARRHLGFVAHLLE